jgi:hypothetical protein
MFHHMAYWNAFAGAPQVLGNMSLVTDTVFSGQPGPVGNNPIFTDQVYLMAAAVLGADTTQAQIYSPSIAPFGNINLKEMGLSATPGSFPRIQDFRSRPIMIPTNEQISALITDTVGVDDSFHFWLCDKAWSRSQVQALGRYIQYWTCAPTRVAGAWSGGYAITYQNQPQGGWYVIHDVVCFNAVCRAFRVIFPKGPTVNNRIWRPGDFCLQALANLQRPGWENGKGDWGSFNTFEPPTIEVLADAAGATTLDLWVDVEFIGNQPPTAGPFTS